MSHLIYRIVNSASLTRSVAIAALLGATLYASPLTAAPADGAATTPTQMTNRHHAAMARKETIEQRISHLHKALKITPDEEANWNSVAQAMRENAAATQKLIDERTAQDPHSMTAVDDLRAYEKFAQAHVDSLKNLTSSFETLYNSMPDPQKKVADHVFQTFGPRGARSHH
jgi:hypothetical protein